MSDFYKGRLVAVTGATGMNGSYIVKALCESGAKVRAVVHERPANDFTRMAGEKVVADLADAEEARKAVRGAEIVMHAAGITGGASLAARDPGAMVAPNAIINSQVIHACARERVERVGVMSSTVVYPPSEKALREEDVWKGEPFELYFGIGWVKRFTEKLCKFYSDNYGLKVSIIRPTGVYGRFDNFDESTSHVLPALVKRVVSGEDPVVVWGDGKDSRDFVHGTDLAQAMLLAVEKYAVCDPVNIASGRLVTTGELAELVMKAVGTKAKIKFDKSKPTAIRTRVVDISKAKRELGYRPAMSLEDGIRDTVTWYREEFR
jgi:GDP-L-fucose synthase